MSSRREQFPSLKKQTLPIIYLNFGILNHIYLLLEQSARIARQWCSFDDDISNEILKSTRWNLYTKISNIWNGFDPPLKVPVYRNEREEKFVELSCYGPGISHFYPN